MSKKNQQKKSGIIGLTGGIGSGKSTVRRVFASMGIPTYDADGEAKKIMISDEALIAGIKELLGNESYTNTGELNKGYISKQIFNNKNLLEKMNALVHPVVKAHFRRWANLQDAPYVIKEVAILYEAGFDKETDSVIAVSAPEDVRIARVCKRDNTNPEAVRARIRNQMSEAEKIKRSEYHIINDGKTAILPQILEIHQKIITKLKNS